MFKINVDTIKIRLRYLNLKHITIYRRISVKYWNQDIQIVNSLSVSALLLISYYEQGDLASYILVSPNCLIYIIQSAKNTHLMFISTTSLPNCSGKFPLML